MPVISPSLRLVIQRTLPLTVGLFATMMVQLVDSIFIGRLGVDELAIHGITLPFQAAFIGVQVGLGVAATSLISQASGAQDSVRASNIATLSVVGGTIFIALLSVVLYLLKAPLLDAFLSGEASREHYVVLQSIFNRYWPFWLFSATSVAALYLVSCVFRANEDSKSTGKMFLYASLMNLVLDPILIFGLDLGIIGAALATSIGYLSCTLYMLLSSGKKHWFSPIGRALKAIHHAKQLAALTVTTTMNQALPSVSAFLCMVFVSSLGTDAIAFWSLLARIEGFLLVFTLALTMAVPPIIGRYLGQGEHSKINEMLATTSKFLLLFHFSAAVIVGFGSSLLIPLINNDPTIQGWFSTVLWVIPFSYGPLGLCMLVVSSFNALGKPKRALLVSVVRLFALYVPAIWVGTSTGDVVNTVICAATANVLAGGYAWLKLQQFSATPIAPITTEASTATQTTS
ncbi:MATE family efflux transporter [Vibrio ulleungensis]|uniref:Multidrug resistance protein NorM n=1 Tax=Vibrio ulleungensis TaxID=2807619 RepID=A0ABS2HCI0_9VIBR|nr:MATE family efflux transporter [Vibrio ulleungensis]MBM7035298.1 MATE family efflux transporter [Vibrio ulleungensis]